MAVVDRQLDRFAAGGRDALDGCAIDETHLTGWPSQRRAAAVLGVNPSSLSRRDLRQVRRGRELCVAPVVVMRLATYYRNRPLGEVAADLVACALEQTTPNVVEAIELELDRCLDVSAEAVPDDGLSWLDEARRQLSPEAYEQVEAVARGEARPHPGLQGQRPGDDDAGDDDAGDERSPRGRRHR